MPFVRLSHNKAERPMNLNPDQLVGQLRPILALAGTVLIAVALVKFAGVQIPLRSAWWELGLAGWLCKQV